MVIVLENKSVATMDVENLVSLLPKILEWWIMNRLVIRLLGFWESDCYGFNVKVVIPNLNVAHEDLNAPNIEVIRSNVIV